MPGATAEADHRSARAALGAVALKQLARRANRPGLARLAGHLGLLAATGVLVLLTEGAARLCAQTAHGIILMFLFAPAHESIHRTAFRTPWLNDLVAQAAGFLLLLPANWFRAFHFAHHRHTQDPARDPELALPKPATLPAYLWRLTGWHYWTGMAGAVLGAALGRPLPAFVPPGPASARIRAEARLYLLGYALIAAASLATGSTLALTLWLIPALLGQPFLRAYLLAEHTACPLVPDMLANSRTTFTSRAIRWLAWEMPYHAAHHTAPQVPFHRLPALNAALRPQLRSTADGYVDAHRQILCSLGG
jgi:fatty acid desaturase